MKVILSITHSEPKIISEVSHKGHMGQNSKQIHIAKYVSKFWIYGAKMSDKCVKSQKKIFCTLSFFAKSS